MHVKCLEYVVYGPTEWGWKANKVSNPSWDNVEIAIRRLDVDMWISDVCWQTLNPVTPFEQLPKL